MENYDYLCSGKTVKEACGQQILVRNTYGNKKGGAFAPPYT